MRSSDVTAGNTIYASDVNKLRDDAFASSWLLAHEQSAPDLTLKVENGTVYFGNTPLIFAGGNSPSFTAPTTNPRIDILSLDDTGTLIRTAGTEAVSPTAPDVPAGNIAIAQIYNRVGQTSIKDTDDTTNGYVEKDLRIFIKQTNGETFYRPTSVHSSVKNGDVVYSPNAQLVFQKSFDIQFGIGSTTSSDNILTSTSHRYAYIFKTSSLANKLLSWQFSKLGNNSVTGTVEFKLYAVDSNLKPTGSALWASGGLSVTGATYINEVSVNADISSNTWYAMVIDGSGLTGISGGDGLSADRTWQLPNTKAYVSSDSGSTWGDVIITSATWKEGFYTAGTVYPAIPSNANALTPKYLGVYKNGEIQTRGIANGYSGLLENTSVYLKDNYFRIYHQISRSNATGAIYSFCGSNNAIGFKISPAYPIKPRNLSIVATISSLSNGIDTFTVKICPISGGQPDEANAIFTEAVTYNNIINAQTNADTPIFFPLTNCPELPAGDYAVIFNCSNTNANNAKFRRTDVGNGNISAVVINNVGTQSSVSVNDGVFYEKAMGTWAPTVNKGINFCMEIEPVSGLANSGVVRVGTATSATSFDIKDA